MSKLIPTIQGVLRRGSLSLCKQGKLLCLLAEVDPRLEAIWDEIVENPHQDNSEQIWLLAKIARPEVMVVSMIVMWLIGLPRDQVRIAWKLVTEDVFPNDWQGASAIELSKSVLDERQLDRFLAYIGVLLNSDGSFHYRQSPDPSLVSAMRDGMSAFYNELRRDNLSINDRDKLLIEHLVLHLQKHALI